MEEQGSAGGAERQIAKLVEDDEIGVGEPGRDLAGFALKLLLFESVDEFDGVVTLSCSEREVSAPQGLLGGPDRRSPRAHRRSAKHAVRLGGSKMALDVESVVDAGVRGEKFLRGTRTLEPLHLALPPPRRQMRILRSVVLPSPALMAPFDPKVSDRGAV
jgi:hypothetical protein